MLILFYFRWIGTPEELKEFVGRMKNISDGIEGIDLKGVFTPPTSEWNACMLYEATSFEKGIETYRTYNQKYGPNPKLPLGHAELLYPFEEVKGYSVTL